VGFQKPVKLTEMTSWSTKKKRSTNDTKFSKKRDANLKRDGIKPKTPIDFTEDTVGRKTRTQHFRRKRKAENRKSNVVVNLSSKPLNSAESSLLSKGLNFCPNPPKINVRELDENLDQFARRLRIRESYVCKIVCRGLFFTGFEQIRKYFYEAFLLV
jgi:hypothetical protein